ncbi:MAG TPA: GGDEF domain-containing protein [Ramlibacter sp.]|jgi:diguanylate cyclase (GGDEF)-like protein
MSNDHNATIIIRDIRKALAATEEEAKQKPACLLVVGGEFNGSIFDLAPGENAVGRNPECAISLDVDGVSRRHCVVSVSQDEVAVTDLGSANGTYLNDRKIEATTVLKRGDVIKISTSALKYLPAGDPDRLTYDKLRAEATTDGLTQCVNKAHFHQLLAGAVKKCKVTGRPLTLAVFDLDHFKKLNDGHGHDAGDFVLSEMARLIRETGLRAGDVFARYGGEEFCILLPDTNLDQGRDAAERIRQSIERHAFIYDGQRLAVTASIGVADHGDGVATATDLFKRADAAVYRSKQQGRNRVSIFQP